MKASGPVEILTGKAAGLPVLDFVKLVSAAFICGILVALTAAAMTLLLAGSGAEDTPNLMQSIAARPSANSGS